VNHYFKGNVMTDTAALLAGIRRPTLLIRAARFGIAEYRRERDLKRLLRRDRVASPARNLDQLMSEEARLEEDRRSGDAAYSVARHIEMLVALIAEARLVSRCPAP